MNDEKFNQASFIEHFTELRSRLLKSFIYLFVFFIICYFFAENIYNFLVQPYADAVKDDQIPRRLIFTALQETFITYLKVAFFASIFIASPIILIQVWKFVAPGLYKNEKKALLPYLIATPTLFLLGGMLVYFLVMPLAIKFFLSFETSAQVGNLLGIKLSLNEFVAFGTLGDYINKGLLSERAIIISTYALCGFANFSSIGIQIGGISAIAPSRKSDLAKVGLKAMFGGAIASWLTATIAGIFI